ncbi:U6 snRNA-associated Sm-like protein LSm4 [Symbiodinium microadriaticum]|uniref:U6 snRNA-associated Sm-like protein LSm4 n=1 Tax=Symbiodinium microadriaticum TaxID=2951 RepID=A0A1Q9DBY8_SYMMI|nr:U6 snRNA-associated Sm-like protein LSm4 [Symbiodinium microadriaticum]
MPTADPKSVTFASFNAMVLPQAVLRSASHGPVLVELKNGDSYSGTLVAVDNSMNIRMEDAILTPHTEHKFERMKECTIRGQFVKFIRFPDDILDRVLATQDAALSGSRKGRGKDGRGRSDEANKMLSVMSMLMQPPPEYFSPESYIIYFLNL